MVLSPMSIGEKNIIVTYWVLKNIFLNLDKIYLLLLESVLLQDLYI